MRRPDSVGQHVDDDDERRDEHRGDDDDNRDDTDLDWSMRLSHHRQHKLDTWSLTRPVWRRTVNFTPLPANGRPGCRPDCPGSGLVVFLGSKPMVEVEG